MPITLHRPVLLSLILGAVLWPWPQSAQVPAQLAPTVHPALPSNASDLWFVPSENDRAARTTATYQALVDGVARYQAGDYAAALALVARPSLGSSALASYAAYYAGMSQLRLNRYAEARNILDGISGRKFPGAVAIAASLGSAEAAEAAGDPGTALRIYERLAADKDAVSDVVLSRLGRAALATGDRRKSAEAYVRVYYEFGLSDSAPGAATQMEALQDQITRTSYKADIGRAQMLFGARRYVEAKAAFQALQSVVSGDDKELVDLRVAECNFNLKQFALARDGVVPYLEKASRLAEARFFHLSALRELGARDQYVARTMELVEQFPDSSWSEEALNNLATHYIVTSDDEQAAQTFKTMIEKFPSGPRAERAAWKYGWWSYRTGNFAEAIRVFEGAAVTFPRSDFRPSYVYWAGRAHGRMGAATMADARLRLVQTDYANSYYGRLATRQLARRTGITTGDAVLPASSSQSLGVETVPIPTAPLIRLLLANGLYDDALAELRYAQRAWGNQPAIDATIAWVYNQRGELRRAISLMRRTYPQFLTAGGEQIPAEILQVIFPLTFWDAIQRESAVRGLDPYVVAALIAQESTFDPAIKSPVNAWGLMQVMPATGRQLARTLGVRNFTTATLTNPEINIKMGTLYFSRLVEQFGGSYYALASYNAGVNRVIRWKAERPGLDEDEFIDDIPFPETQNYVKRILGTAEDYRMLYGNGTGTPRPPAVSAARPAAASAAKPVPSVKAPAKKTTKKPVAKKPAPKKKKAPAKKR